ncbi:transporter [Lithospermum erythrorhizon]|uniref:Protein DETOXIFICATION n=1 Tax=Lithospermum erythrorhizon TaxID=34254 RepID=A0AAV3NW97_LITER
MEGSNNAEQYLPLVGREENQEWRKIRWGEMGEEMKKLGYLAGPMMAITLSQLSMQVISLTMVGHLSELSLSSTAIAVSISNVTGFTFLLGMASALETLSGQAYGAKQYKMLGTQLYTAVFCLLIVCIPLSIIWLYMENILILIGQDPQISHEAGKFITWLIPALFAYAILQPLVRYFQMQTMIVPMFLSSFFTICFHIPVCWILVFKTGLYNAGAAVSMGLSFWLNAIILGLYMRYSPSCEKTRSPISIEIFGGIKEFIRFAVPSAIMVCLEWWSFELVILLSGLLPNPQLETSVLSVCLSTMSTLYAIPFGLSGAVSTRVSNELGSGNPRRAKVSVVTVILMSVTEMILISIILFSTRNVFGYIYSNEIEVVMYVTIMTPLLCISVMLDCLNGTISGIARGCGWQHIGAYVNLISFYLFGIPIAIALSFWLNFGGKGLWIGIISGATLQACLMSTITIRTNWEKEVIKARERLFD